MNRKEDYIEDLFRNKEHLLEEKPPRRAWSKLEEKLDLEKAQSTRRIYRYISTAAAVIAIVAMVSAIVLFENSTFERNSQVVAMNEETTPKDLSINNNASDWRKEYAPDSVTKEIETIEEETTIINNDITVSKKEPIAELKFVKPSIQKEVPKTTTSPRAEESNVEIPTSMNTEFSTPNEEVVLPTAKPTSVPQKVKKEEIITASSTNGNLSDVHLSNASEPAIEARKAEVRRASDASNVITSSTYSNDNGYSKSKKSKVSKPVISDFYWLLGSWKNPTTNGLSYEKWEITGKNTLAANGYLIQGTDTTFIETMELKQSRNKIYYITNLNGNKASLKFELKSLENNIATFENTKNSFPKEVILRKDGNNNFIITYEEEMDKLQEQKLQYRNNISNAKASRRMSRAGY